MADTTIIRGDSYAIRRPLFTHTFVDENGAPFDLTGCTVRSTFKTKPEDILIDTTDSTAVVKATLIVDGSGTPTTQTKMYLVGAATAGVCELRLSSTDTAGLAPETDWYSDVELIDGNGETFTFLFTDKVRAIDAYTNRTVG